MSYMVDKSPAEDKLIYSGVRPWEPKEHKPVLTASRSAYKPYSTYVDSCAVGSLAQPLTSKQSQEQVLTVAAQVRTSVKRSCMNLRDAFIDGGTTLQALWDLLCYVNIVWFKVHIQTSVRLAVLAVLAMLATTMKNSTTIAC
jgi:hypothetical protein